MDVSAELGGYFADTGGTRVVPPGNPLKTRLCHATRTALNEAMKHARAGARISSIGAAKTLKGGRLFITPMRIALPDHDLLVGFALCIFYTLLLSISEYTGFNTAYAIAATATVSLIGMYVWSVFHSGKTALGFTTALGGLYGYIYILIQLEDYALLFGSIGLFVILAILMYFSRKIDWYGAGRIMSAPVV